MGLLSTGPKARFPVALGHRCRDRSLHQLHLLRSFLPSTNPFALTQREPSAVAAAFLGFRPFEDQTVQASEPVTRLNPYGPKLESRLATPGIADP
jgi:hypothetical protein